MPTPKPHPLQPEHPDAEALAYFRELAPLVARLHALTLEALAPILERWPEPEERGDALRLDLRPGEKKPRARAKPERRTVEEALRQGAAKFLREFPEKRVRQIAAKAITLTRKKADKEFRAQVEKVAGRRFKLADTPAVRRAVRQATRENVALIGSIPKKHHAQVLKLVMEQGEKGARQATLAKLLRERYGVTRRRATLIARDQTGKLFGVLQEVRQTEAGIRDYIWHTVRDNRVRPRHAKRHGKRCRWSRPPSGGHPGSECNCRCWAEPVITARTLTNGPPKRKGNGAGAAPARKAPPARRTPPRAPARKVPARRPQVKVTAMGATVARKALPPPPRPPKAPALPKAPRASKAPPATLGGTGGAEAARAFPRLAETLGTKLRVDDFGSPRVHQQVEALAQLPPGLLRTVGERISEIHVAPRPLPELGEGLPLAGRTDLAETSGIFLRESRKVLVDTRSGTSLVHEFGHAVDATLGDLAVTGEWQGIAQRMRQGGHRYSTHPYYAQPGRYGDREAFAESFATLMETPHLLESRWGPEVARYMRERFGPDAWRDT